MQSRLQRKHQGHRLPVPLFAGLRGGFRRRKASGFRRVPSGELHAFSSAQFLY